MGLFDDILTKLGSQATTRPDIGGTTDSGISPAATPVSTFAGRVVSPGEGIADIMARMPMGSTEGDITSAIQNTLGTLAPQAAQGGGMLAKLAMAKIFGRAREGTPAPRISGGKRFYDGPQIAELAKSGEKIQTPAEKLWPAWINEKTGEVHHALEPITQGWHGNNPPLGNEWVRGHVDPATWKAFTDKMFDAAAQGAR